MGFDEQLEFATFRDAVRVWLAEAPAPDDALLEVRQIVSSRWMIERPLVYLALAGERPEPALAVLKLWQSMRTRAVPTDTED